MLKHSIQPLNSLLPNPSHWIIYHNAQVNCGTRSAVARKDNRSSSKSNWIPGASMFSLKITR